MPTIDEIREFLTEALREGGTSVESLDIEQLEEGRIDVKLRTEGDRSFVIVIVKGPEKLRVAQLKGLLARGILESGPHRASGLDPVVLLLGPRIGRRARRELDDYMRTWASELGWGVLDDDGNIHLRVPALDLEIHEEASPEGPRRQTMVNTKAFTDLNRWLLKVLCLRDAPTQMWLADESLRADIENPTALHRAAGVSQAKAYQFARTFRDLGFLRWDRQHFDIPSRRRLFSLWYEEERQLHVEATPVRTIFGTGADIREIFADADSAGIEYAIGGFEACRVYDVLHAPASGPEVFVFGSVQTVIDALDLERCESRDADVHLLQPPNPESVRRGVIEHARVRVVDILQVALDCARHPQRGREQAEYIVKSVLGWT